MADINDQLGIAFSLRKFIEERTGVDSIIHYNGIKLPGNLPFVKVRAVLSPHRYVSKGRETIATDFNFEISLHDKSFSELTKNQDGLRRLLLFEDIPYYRRNGERVPDASFSAEIRNENHVSAEDITDKTSKHRVYFEITVEGTHHKYIYKIRGDINGD